MSDDYTALALLLIAAALSLLYHLEQRQRWAAFRRTWAARRRAKGEGRVPGDDNRFTG